MKIGQTLCLTAARAEYELLKDDMSNIVILKESEEEIIKKFDSKKESYAVIYKLKNNEFYIFELLRLSGIKNETQVEEKLLRLSDVMEYVPFSRGKIYTLIADGLFPKQLKIGCSSLWKKSEILKYVNNAGN